MTAGITSKKIGILGGSFDPVHRGHINIAKSAYDEFDLDEVWFIPAGHTPHKDENEMTSAEDRAEMAALAILDYPNFKISRIEIESKGTSFTYLTLTKLKDLYPNHSFYFIMGADSLDYFEYWSHPEIICEKAVILTAVRNDIDLARIRDKISYLKRLFQAEIYPIMGGRTDISSTELRSCIRLGGYNSQMLPERVAEYIKNHHLYGCRK